MYEIRLLLSMHTKPFGQSGLSRPPWSEWPSALKAPREIITYADSQLPEMFKSGALMNGRRWGRSRMPDPVLVFNTFRFDKRDAEEARAKAVADFAAG